MMIHICGALTLYEKQIDSYIYRLLDNQITWHYLASSKILPTSFAIFDENNDYDLST